MAKNSDSDEQREASDKGKGIHLQITPYRDSNHIYEEDNNFGSKLLAHV